jgi:hypothetical protein
LKAETTRNFSRQRGRRVTILDVARHAGVSHMTVSRVINGDSKVREKTRLVVAASIKALRYSPNPAARNLANSQGFLIGLCYANPTDAYLAEILLGCFTQANLSRCQLVLEPRREAESEAAAVARLSEKDAAALQFQSRVEDTGCRPHSRDIVDIGTAHDRLWLGIHRRPQGGPGDDRASPRPWASAYRLHHRPSQP